MAEKKEKQAAAVRNKIMPNNLELEKQILGTFMTDPEGAFDFIGRVAEDDFYSARHKIIFNEIKNRITQGLPYDLVSLSSSMTEDVKDKVGGFAYLTDLSGSYISSATLENDIAQLQQLSQLRKVIFVSDAICDKAFNNEDAASVLSFAQTQIYEVTGVLNKKDLTSAYEAVDSVLNDITDKYNNPTLKNIGLKTGFRLLDDITNGGFLPGQMIVLAARPGCGKTSFAMNVAANIVRSDPKKVVAVFNLEMSAAELVKRLLATYTGIDSKLISKVELSPEDYQKLIMKKAEFARQKLFIDDSSDVSASDIMMKARRLKVREGRLDLVIIDHMQLISEDKNSKKGKSRYELMTEVSRMVKIMAKELGVPVIVLSQTSRSVEQDENKQPGIKREPKMSDLRESGAIEQDADMIIFLTDDDFILAKQVENRKPIKACVLKNRAGELRDLYYEWQLDTSSFYEREHVNREGKENTNNESANNKNKDEDSYSGSQMENEEYSEEYEPEFSGEPMPSDLLESLQASAGESLYNLNDNPDDNPNIEE